MTSVFKMIYFQVFQRRVSNSVDFNRNWEEYRRGFGWLNDSYWLG